MKKALFVGCLVVLIAGCGKKPTSTSVSAESPSETAQLSQEPTKTSAAAQNKIQLLSAGAEPRQQLRFSAPANAKQTLQLTMNMDMGMSVGGQAPRRVKTPPIQMTMESQVAKIDANGDTYVDFSYSDADITANPNIPAEAVNAMRSQLQKVVGLKGSLIVDSQGNVKNVNLNLPETLDPNAKRLVAQMTSSLKQISSPVPSEAVGVGAKWQVPTSVTANGMALNQSATYELVELKDNVATMQLSIEQQAESQQINLPGLPAGASMQLKSLNSQGNGKVTRALNQIMPIRSNISVQSDTQMAAKEPGSQKETTMGMNSVIELNLESK